MAEVAARLHEEAAAEALRHQREVELDALRAQLRDVERTRAETQAWQAKEIARLHAAIVATGAALVRSDFPVKTACVSAPAAASLPKVSSSTSAESSGAAAVIGALAHAGGTAARTIAASPRVPCRRAPIKDAGPRVPCRRAPLRDAPTAATPTLRSPRKRTPVNTQGETPRPRAAWIGTGGAACAAGSSDSPGLTSRSTTAETGVCRSVALCGRLYAGPSVASGGGLAAKVPPEPRASTAPGYRSRASVPVPSSPEPQLHTERVSVSAAGFIRGVSPAACKAVPPVGARPLGW